MSSNIIYLYDSNLLESKAQVIAQQCNCVSKKAAGLALDIAKTFPHADFYSKRTSPSKPGTIKIVGNKKKGERFVMAMFAQYNPGKPPSKGEEDTAKQREEWFKKCLDEITKKSKRLKSIAFPAKIGCGLAGGIWFNYHSMIASWAEKNPGIKVYIVSKEGPNSEAPEISEPSKTSKVSRVSKTLPPKEIVVALSREEIGDAVNQMCHLIEQNSLTDSELSRLQKAVNAEYDRRNKFTCIYGEHGTEFYWAVVIREDDMTPKKKKIRKWLVETFDVDVDQSIVEIEQTEKHIHSIEYEAPRGFANRVDLTYSGMPSLETMKKRFDRGEVKGAKERFFENLLTPEVSELEPQKRSRSPVNYSDISLKEFTKDYPVVWEKFFGNLLVNGGLDEISDFLAKEAKRGEVIYPPLHEVYTVFDQCPLSDIKVLIIGQDPYHSPGAAMGVAFGHHPDRGRIQPSLLNIYKELEREGFEYDRTSGDLTKWVNQGVFLINTALTVRKGEPGSHASKKKSVKGPWEYFTDQVFREIARKTRLIVVMWGAYAAGFKDSFTKKGHIKMFSSHPSTYSWKSGEHPFWGSDVFRKINRQLKKWGEKEIDWNLV